MTDLSQKFAAFEQQSAAQHNALMAALTQTNNKLDVLISLQGGAPPAPGATLADVLAAIGVTNDRMLGVLGMLGTPEGERGSLAQIGHDIHLDTMSIDLKLLAMRNALVTAMPVAPPVQDALTDLRAMAIDDHNNLISLLTQTIAINAVLGLNAGDATTTIRGLLSSLQYSNAGIYASMGISTSAGDNVLQLLNNIEACSCTSGTGVTPGNVCTQPFVSSGSALVPFVAIGGNNVLVATWSAPLPDGTTFGTTFGLATDNGELHRNDWTGWRVYVQSSASNYADQATSLSRYPTNTWRQLPAGAASYSFAVAGNEGLTVTLCPSDTTVTEEITVQGIGQDVITQVTTITGPSNVEWLGGQSPTGVLVDCVVGGNTTYIGAIGIEVPFSDVIGGPFPRTIGFTVGRTDRTSTVKVHTPPATH